MENIIKNKKNAFHTLLMIGLIGWMSACNSDPKTDTSDQTNTARAYENDADAAATELETDANAWMQEIDNFVSTNREIGTRIDNDLKTYESKLESMDTKSRKAMQESINSLRIKRKNLDTKLQSLENASEDSWAQMKQDVTDAGTELESTWDAFDKQYSRNN
jgi:predicted  nucleic acid-binding Zn-ribbon protein